MHSTQANDFLDFCGKVKLDFSHINLDNATKLGELIAGKASLATILAAFKDDLDELVQCAVYLFKNNLLNRNQVTTFLEYRMIKMGFDNVTVAPATDYPHLKNFMFFPKEKEFLNMLEENPQNNLHENFYSYTISVDKLSQKRSEFYEFAQVYKLVHLNLSEDKKTLTVTCPSFFARKLLNKAFYGQHAKELLARLGVFSIDDMEKSMRNKSRYGAVDYPGIENTKSFHSIEAPLFEVLLHDELHTRFISSIPNTPYDGLFYAIDIIREKTAIHWSKEIWNMTDMEVNIFSNTPTLPYLYKNPQPQKIIEDFILLLTAKIASTEKDMGLFSYAILNTSLILIIHMVLNKDEWLQRNIDPDQLETIKTAFSSTYLFVKKLAAELKEIESPAEQVAFVLNKMSGLSVKVSHFSKTKDTNLIDLDITHHDTYLDLFIHKNSALAELNSLENDAHVFAKLLKLRETPEAAFDEVNFILTHLHLNTKIELSEFIEFVKKLPALDMKILNFLKYDKIVLESVIDREGLANLVAAFDEDKHRLLLNHIFHNKRIFTKFFKEKDALNDFFNSLTTNTNLRTKRNFMLFSPTCSHFLKDYLKQKIFSELKLKELIASQPWVYYALHLPAMKSLLLEYPGLTNKLIQMNPVQIVDLWFKNKSELEEILLSFTPNFKF